MLLKVSFYLNHPECKEMVLDEHSESDRMLKILSEYDNVKLMHFNLKRYVQNTTVAGLWVNGNIQNSNYPISHASDILR